MFSNKDCTRDSWHRLSNDFLDNQKKKRKMFRKQTGFKLFAGDTCCGEMPFVECEDDEDKKISQKNFYARRSHTLRRETFW